MTFISISKPFLMKWAAILALCTTIVLAGFFLISNRYWSDGDETHYLIMTNSFLADRDFDLKNNYLSREYFAHRGKEVGLHGIVAESGAWVTHHDLLLPILVSPGYYARGIIGARAIMFLMFVIGLLGLFYYLKLLKFSTQTSLWTTALFGLQMPIFAYSHYVYTDLLSGFFMVFSLIPLFLFLKKKEGYLLLLSGLGFGVSTLLHVKLIIFGPLLLLSFFIYYFSDEFKDLDWKKLIKPTREKIEMALYLGIPFTLCVALISLKNYLWVGNIRPDAIHNLIVDNRDDLVAFFDYNPIHITLRGLAMFFDGESGVFLNAPLLLIGISGLVIWYRKSRATFLLIMVPLTLLFIRQSAFIVWRTWGPPARYLMVFLPVMLPAFAYGLEAFWKHKVLKYLVLVLSFLSILITSTLFFAKSSTVNGSGYPNYKQGNLYARAAANYIGQGWLADAVYTEVFDTTVLRKNSTDLIPNTKFRDLAIILAVTVVFASLPRLIDQEYYKA